MRNLLAILAAVLLTASVFAQSPEKMSYQAVIRNSSNTLVTNTIVGMQISILQGSASGTTVYVETQNPNTNVNGLVSIEIGTGTVVSGDFTTIDWANGQYFIKTETDPTGGTSYTITGTSQLLSVPYALHAKTAETVTGGITETDPVFVASPANGITTGDITNWNNKLNTEVDSSVTNEIQILSISNDTIYLTDGGFAKLPAGFNGDFNSLSNVPANLDTDATNDFDGDYNNLSNTPDLSGYLTTEVDGSVTNEIQILSISNDTIYLTDGGFAKLPAGFNGDFNSLSNVPVNLDTDATNDFDGDYNNLSNTPDLSGYLTTEVDGSVTNEIQILSISNDTIYLTDGGFAKLPAGFDGQYNSLSGAPTNVSTFTNDANYLTSFTEIDGSVTNEIQTLSVSGNDLTISGTGGNTVTLPSADGSETKVTAGTNVTITGSGTTASPYVVNSTGATTLTIGQSYQGGIIFWLDASGQHGLIAATADQSTGIQWYNGTYRYTGTTGDGLYAGAMNTALIVATQMADNQTGNFAAKVCADYSVIVGGVTYGDWYLPSKYELNLLYQQKTAVGGFASAIYWSSSESDNNGVLGQDFGSGYQGAYWKNESFSLRAIRIF